jgi:hypothetical protein
MLREIFDLFFADLGGAAQVEDLSDFAISDFYHQEFHAIQATLSNISDDINTVLLSRGRSEKIYIAISNDLSINACCGRHQGDTYLIASNLGVLVRLRAILQILLEINCGNEGVFSKRDRSWIYNLFGYRPSRSDAKSFIKISDKGLSLCVRGPHLWWRGGPGRCRT